MVYRLSNGNKAVLRDAQGSVLPLAAVAMLLGAGIVGSGIDISRAYRVQNRLQAACDAGVLAGRRAISRNGFDSAAQAKAHSFFDTNFNDETMGTHDTAFVPDTEDDGATVIGNARTKVNTAVMMLYGFDEFDLNVECQSSMGMGNADVVMVLDTTGSMATALGAGTRISALQDAMRAFYDTVAMSTRSSNARIRYGFVPYSQSVNVGRLLDPDWIVDRMSAQTRVAVFRDDPAWSAPTAVSTTEYTPSAAGSTGASVQHSSTDYNDQTLCTNALPANIVVWTNTGTAETVNGDPVINAQGQRVTTKVVSQPQYKRVYFCQLRTKNNKYRVWRTDTTRTAVTTTVSTETPTTKKVFDHYDYKRRDDIDVSAYKQFQSITLQNGTNGANQTSKWAGCIEERGTVRTATVSWSNLTGITPLGMHDLDIDSEPNVWDDATRWKPIWPELSYYRAGDTNSVTTTGTKSSFACPAQAQLLQEMDEGSFDAFAGSLVATGSTYLDLGLLWGGRLSSPDGIFADTVNIDPDNGAEVARHIIFMTDGDMDPTQTAATSYGVETIDRRITTDGSDSQAKSRHLSRFRAICSAIKAKGIRIWVIAFTASLSNDLKNCASDESSFLAGDADELDEAFQEIAKNVGELRVVH